MSRARGKVDLKGYADAQNLSTDVDSVEPSGDAVAPEAAVAEPVAVPSKAPAKKPQAKKTAKRPAKPRSAAQTPRTASKRSQARTEAPSAPQAPQTAAEAGLERKDVWMTAEQVDFVDMLVKRARREGMVGRAVSQSTVHRVAVQLLMARADEVHGTTETDLLKSLGL